MLIAVAAIAPVSLAGPVARMHLPTASALAVAVSTWV
jgi:hypothetical protein